MQLDIRIAKNEVRSRTCNHIHTVYGSISLIFSGEIYHSNGSEKQANFPKRKVESVLEIMSKDWHLVVLHTLQFKLFLYWNRTLHASLSKKEITFVLFTVHKHKQFCKNVGSFLFHIIRKQKNHNAVICVCHIIGNYLSKCENNFTYHIK